jgi:ABC-type multidrug transport system fused ATPase/permease subunit
MAMNGRTASIHPQSRAAATAHKRSLWSLLRYVRPYKWHYLGAAVCGLYRFLMPVSIIWIFGEAVDALSAAGAGGLSRTEAWQRVLGLFWWGVGIAAVSPLPIYLRSVLSARASWGVVNNLRCDLYAHMQKLSHPFFDRNRSGALTSRVMTDVQAVQPFLKDVMVDLWVSLGSITVVLGYFFWRSWMLGLLALAIIPVQVVVLRTIGRRVRHMARDIRDQLAYLAAETQQKLAAPTIVKVFTREFDEIQHFAEDSSLIASKGIARARIHAFSAMSTALAGTLAPLLVILIGGRIGLFHPGTLSIGLLVQFVMMQNRIYEPFARLSEMQIVMADAMGALDRIFEIFATEPEVADRPGAVQAPRFRGEVRFERVSFSYAEPDRPVINALDLEAPARSVLALVGRSGSGKSTIASLLCRFYDVDSGRILIDGRDIREYTVYSLRHQIGLVPQDPALFSGSVEANILYGRPDASAEEVRAAARRAFADEFIDALPDGYQTLLGERGLVLSGGQKQRIAIARAFLKDPAILVLDEATSALDSESEAVIQRALAELMKDRTTIVIAHRLSTIQRADCIAVIEAGRLVECGSHATLLARGGWYARLYRQQGLRGGTLDTAGAPPLPAVGG